MFRITDLRSLVFSLLLVSAGAAALVGITPSSEAQSSAKGIICPASGTSIQAVAANGSRLSLVLLNDGSVNSIRFGGNNLGTLPVLDDTNSSILLPGSSYAFNLPGLYYGRVICMSTTATPITIHVTESTYP